MDKKPNIEEVWSVFQLHQTETLRVMQEFRMGEWERELKNVRAKFKLRLDELNLGQYIDWTEK